MKKSMLLLGLMFPLTILAWPNPPITVWCENGVTYTFNHNPIRDRENNRYSLEASVVRGEFIVVKNTDFPHSVKCYNTDPNPPPQQMDYSQHGGNYKYVVSPPDYFDHGRCKSLGGCTCPNGEVIPIYRFCR